MPNPDNYTTSELIALHDKYIAHNYQPYPVVASTAQGSTITTHDGTRLVDFYATYSANNLGHNHPRIIAALDRQKARMATGSRAIISDQLPLLGQRLCELLGKDKYLPMVTGGEATETAFKASRRWGYTEKGIPTDKAEIIFATNNFHGRGMGVLSGSTEDLYKDGFGPFLPGIKWVPYGDAAALETVINDNTAAFFVEPVQGEGGVLVPPDGYLRQVAEITKHHNVLLVTDEVQTGFGRTGHLMGYEHDGLTNDDVDIVIIGKSLGGGELAVSGILADNRIMDVFVPGNHGSTFGGNPLSSAVAREAIEVILEEKLAERSRRLGAVALDELRALNSPFVADIRGRGLFTGIQIADEYGPALPFCMQLLHRGVIAKDTHSQVIRIAPPLNIPQEDFAFGLDQFAAVLRPPNHI